MKYTTLKDSFNGYFLNVIKEQYSDFDGRTGREDYWMYLLWFWVIAIALSIISFAIFFICCLSKFLANYLIVYFFLQLRNCKTFKNNNFI